MPTVLYCGSVLRAIHFVITRNGEINNGQRSLTLNHFKVSRYPNTSVIELKIIHRTLYDYSNKFPYAIRI